MNRATADLVVVGAGPAGANAALTASGHGLDVVLIDAAAAAGGQVWRAPGPAVDAAAGASDPDRAAGDALRHHLQAAKVRHLTGHKVWAVAERFRVDVAGPDGAFSIRAPRVVAATGAHERIVPFPGWTLPGVIGLAAATILMKAEGLLPGRRLVIAGCGPLLANVAAKAVAAGADVRAVVDLAPRSAWLKATAAMASRPALLRQGASWVLKLLAARVPIHHGQTVLTAEGVHRVERVTIGPADGASGGATTIDGIDALIVGHGLVPGSEITRLLGAKHVYDQLRGGWVPVLDDVGRTSVPGLYACGDGSGIRGALPAVTAGRRVGLAVARDAGTLGSYVYGRSLADLDRGAAAARRFADASAGLMALRPDLVARIAPSTVVCRCEDVTRAEIDAALAAGAHDVNQLKHFTRCGMGPCQGRMCGDVVGELAALKLGSRKAAGCWTQRPPLHPVPMADLVGRFDYADIPVPKPAPL